MNWLSRITGNRPLPPPAVPPEQVKTASGEIQGHTFLRGLGLPPETLQQLARIASAISGRMPPPALSETQLADRTFSQQTSQDYPAMTNASRALGRELHALAEKAEQAPPENKPALDAQWEKIEENYAGLVNDLEAFEHEAYHLFQNKPELLAALRVITQEIRAQYKLQLDSAAPPAVADFAAAQEKIDGLKQQAAELIISYAKSADQLPTEQVPVEGKKTQAVTGLQMVANILRGAKVEKLCNTAANVRALAVNLKLGMGELAASSDRTLPADPIQRREAFRNIKFIQERSADLATKAVNKTAKQSFLERLKGKVEHYLLKREIKEINRLADEYYKDLNFNDDEVTEFQDLSFEAHRPKRAHLVAAANAIVEGAQRAVDDRRAGMRKKLIEACAEEGLVIVDWHTIAGIIGASNSKKLVSMLAEYNLENRKLEIFEGKIVSMRERARTHPALGNNNGLENLSFSVIESKAQQKAAKEAIQGLLDGLIEAYVAVDAVGTLPKKLPEADLEAAAKALQAGRDAVLADVSVWGKPIVRVVNVPSGPASNVKDGTGKVHVTHAMTPLTYAPSSAFRGREASADNHQPNFFRVDVNGRTYTSSATNVEFFQLDEVKRKAATLQQTAEVALTKVDAKLATLSPEERSKATLEIPIVVDIVNVSLLSPDTLREWIAEHQKVGHVVEKVKESYGVDPSKQERRMLKESVEGWQAFDSANPNGTKIPEEKEFVIKDMDGRERKLVAETNNRGQRVFALVETDAEGVETKTYVRFDVSCYNVGTNKFTQMMNSSYDSSSGDKAVSLTKGTDAASPIAFFKGKTGSRLEDDLNAIAFTKDTKRFISKLDRIKAEKDGLLSKDGFDKALVEKFESRLGKEGPPPTGLRELRQNWVNAERAYRIGMAGKAGKVDVDALKKACNAAFGKWQGARQAVAVGLARELQKDNLSEPTQKYLELIQHEEDLRDLYQEVSDQLEFRDYRSEQGMHENMYSLSSALVCFGAELGADPHTGCRSGKDRTSLQRIEIATRLAVRETNGRFLHYREMEQTPGVYETRERMMLDSGHIDEMARLNTGGRGLNLSGSHGTFLKEVGAGGEVYPVRQETTVLHGVKDAFIMNFKYRNTPQSKR